MIKLKDVKAAIRFFDAKTNIAEKFILTQNQIDQLNSIFEVSKQKNNDVSYLELRYLIGRGHEIKDVA